MTTDASRQDFSRNAASKKFDRRTLIKAGAWAAPVLVLTTAAPAHAASYPTPGGAGALVLDNFTIDGVGNITGTGNTGTSSAKKRIDGNFQFEYNPNNWGAAWDVTVPTSLSVTYSLKVAGVVIESGSSALGQYSTIHANWKTSNDLVTGNYLVEFHVTAPAQTINGNTFTPATIIVSAQVQVNN